VRTKLIKAEAFSDTEMSGSKTELESSLAGMRREVRRKKSEIFV